MSVYTKEIVEKAYKLLNSCNDPAQIQECNKLLTQFQASEAAWTICQELLISPDPLIQFFAAHILHTKLSNLIGLSYDNSALFSLLQYVFNILNQGTAKLPATIHKLLNSVAQIFIYTCSDVWGNAMSDLLTYSTKSDVCAQYAFDILEHVAIESAKIWELKPQIKDYLTINFINLLSVSKEVISSSTHSVQVKKYALKCLEAWISFPFISVNSTVAEILAIAFYDLSLLEAVSPCIAKYLERAALQLDIKKAEDLPTLYEFIKVLLCYLSLPEKRQLIGKNMALAEIICSIGQNCTFILRNKDGLSQHFIGLALEVLKSNDTAILYSAFETWEHIVAFIENCTGFEYLYGVVLSALEAVRVSCRYGSSTSINEESEGAWEEYRLFAGNTMQDLFSLLFMRDNENAMNYLKAVAMNSQSDIVAAENFVFLVTAILELFEELEEPASCVSDALGVILRFPMEPPLLQAALEFFKAAAVQLSKAGDKILPEVISYCLRSMQNHEKTQRLASEAFLEVVERTEGHISNGVITAVNSEIINIGAKITPENLQIVAKGLGVCIGKCPISADPAISIYFKNAAIAFTHSMQHYLCAAVGFLKGLLKSKVPVTKEVADTLIREVWNILCEIVKKYGHERIILELVVEAFCSVLESVKEKADLKEELLAAKVLLDIFLRDPANCVVLKTFSLFTNSIVHKTYMEHICENFMKILPNCSSNCALNLIEHVAEYCAAAVGYFINSKHFMNILKILSDTFANVIDVAMEQKVLLVYRAVILCDLPQESAFVDELIKSVIFLVFNKLKSVKRVVIEAVEVVNAVLLKFGKEGHGMVEKILAEFKVKEEDKNKLMKRLWERKGNVRKLAVAVKEFCKALNSTGQNEGDMTE